MDKISAKAKLIKAKAEAKAIRRQSKGELIKAKQSLSKTRARMAGMASIAASVSSAFKNNGSQSNANRALSEWVDAIKGTQDPAEGTGTATSGSSNSNGSGPSTTGQPVGNYLRG